MKRLCCHTVEWRQAYCFLRHMLEVSAVRLHACTKTLAPLVNCIVNDALVDVTPDLLQTLTVSVRQCRAPATGRLSAGRRSCAPVKAVATHDARGIRGILRLSTGQRPCTPGTRNYATSPADNAGVHTTGSLASEQPWPLIRLVTGSGAGWSKQVRSLPLRLQNAWINLCDFRHFNAVLLWTHLLIQNSSNLSYKVALAGKS